MQVKTDLVQVYDCVTQGVLVEGWDVAAWGRCWERASCLYLLAVVKTATPHYTAANWLGGGISGSTETASLWEQKHIHSESLLQYWTVDVKPHEK